MENPSSQMVWEGRRKAFWSRFASEGSCWILFLWWIKPEWQSWATSSRERREIWIQSPAQNVVFCFFLKVNDHQWGGKERYALHGKSPYSSQQLGDGSTHCPDIWDNLIEKFLQADGGSCTRDSFGDWVSQNASKCLFPFNLSLLVLLTLNYFPCSL